MPFASDRFRPLLGATPQEGATTFRVRAPEAARVGLVLLPADGTFTSTSGRHHAMTRDADGLFAATIDNIGDGARYGYRVDGRGPFPDPASRWQPDGVHGPSAVVDWATFAWTDGEWRGVPIERTVLYELHVGTFTPEGTFTSAADRLGDIADLGVTAIELMPVADFPGQRNWGYDGVAPFAPSRAYGRPDDLRGFVDRAHAFGLAVHLDVVYNHLGPDGAYQAMFNPHFYSATHKNPWGAGLNFDGPRGQHVREYFIENALRWVHEYHVDGLRLDATHAIADDSPTHIVAALAERVQIPVSGRPRRAAPARSSAGAGAAPRVGLDDRPGGHPAHIVLVIAEDERNLNTIVRSRAEGGWGLDGLWADDLHHQLRVTLAGDRDGYFADYDGGMDAIATTARQGWFYTGQPSPHRGEPRGTHPTGVPLARAVVCLQNHDQVGNRAFGERLHHTIDIAAWHAASTFLLALPGTPLLFMGQEWAASSPFLYFTDHNDDLGRLVTEGRRREFGRFAAFVNPATRETIPDPQAASTFERSRLDWTERVREPHATTLALYRRLLHLRRTAPAMADARGLAVGPAGDDGLVVRRGEGEGALLFVVRLRGSGALALDDAAAQPPDGCVWHVLFTTEDPSSLKAGLPGASGVTAAPLVFPRPGAVVYQAVRADEVSS